MKRAIEPSWIRTASSWRWRASTATPPKRRATNTPTAPLTVTAGGENTFVITLKTAAQEAWDGVTETEPAKDEDGVYQITNGAELAWFTKQSQSGAAVTGVLCNDIDLANYPWTYKGASGGNATILDGQGHEIIKLNSAVGLFYYMNNGSQLRNLTVRGSVNAADNAGGIVYDFRGSLIENVTSYVDVTVTATSTRGAGGIVYAMRNGAIRNCANHGSVSSTYSTGGIVGSIYGWDVTIEGCYNTGNISSTNSGVGGIVGAATYNQLISDCYNTGTITGKQYVGGLVGDFRGGSSGSAQYQGPVTLTNGYNVGVVTGSVDDATYVASVAGRVQSAKLVNCYYLDTPSAGDANAVALSDAQLRAQELGVALRPGVLRLSRPSVAEGRVLPHSGKRCCYRPHLHRAGLHHLCLPQVRRDPADGVCGRPGPHRGSREDRGVQDVQTVHLRRLR